MAQADLQSISPFERRNSKDDRRRRIASRTCKPAVAASHSGQTCSRLRGNTPRAHDAPLPGYCCTSLVCELVGLHAADFRIGRSAQNGSFRWRPSAHDERPPQACALRHSARSSPAHVQAKLVRMHSGSSRSRSAVGWRAAHDLGSDPAPCLCVRPPLQSISWQESLQPTRHTHAAAAEQWLDASQRDSHVGSKQALLRFHGVCLHMLLCSLQPSTAQPYMVER